MRLVHLKDNDDDHTKPTLCGKQSNTYKYLKTYLVYPNLCDYLIQYPKDYEWCPDCTNHPEVVMVRLNGTNV